MSRADERLIELHSDDLAKYLEDDGRHCPICESVDLEWGSLEFEAGIVNQNVSCINCKVHWYDIYHLTDVTEMMVTSKEAGHVEQA